MVRSYTAPLRVYRYPFELVIAAYDRRFPTCPQIPYLMETEILEETTTADGAVTVTERKLQTMVPQLIQDVSGAQFLYFNQKMATDRRNRVMTVETRNISFTGPSYPGKVHFTETSKYYACSINPKFTCLEQQFIITAPSFFGFEDPVEELALSRGKQLIQDLSQVLDEAIEQLLWNGILYIPEFSSFSEAPSATDIEENFLLTAFQVVFQKGSSFSDENFASTAVVKLGLTKVMILRISTDPSKYLYVAEGPSRAFGGDSEELCYAYIVSPSIWPHYTRSTGMFEGLTFVGLKKTGEEQIDEKRVSQALLETLKQ